MKSKEKFITAIETLFTSWGSDPPDEAFWAGNELLEWYEEEYSIKIPHRFDEEAARDGKDYNFDLIVDFIRNI